MHTDIDALLLDLDSNFGLAELLDDPSKQPSNSERLRAAASLQDLKPVGELSTEELAREAAATAAAAGRSRAAAAHALQLVRRARADMMSDRAKAAASAEYVSAIVLYVRSHVVMDPARGGASFAEP